MQPPIHVTTLSKVIQCPYNFKHAEYNIDIAKTIPWDTLNISVLSNGPIDRYIQRYQDNFTVDFKQIQMMIKSFKEARDYVKDLKTDNFVYQEAKHYIKWNDYMIVWSTDLMIAPTLVWNIFRVEDLKFSTHDYYMKPELMEYDAQSFIYPLMAMDYHKVDEVEFSFVCRDKKKGTMKKNTIIRHRQECQDYLDKVMMLYTECEALGERPRCHNTFCEWCPLKDWCPERFTK